MLLCHRCTQPCLIDPFLLLSGIIDGHNPINRIHSPTEFDEQRAQIVRAKYCQGNQITGSFFGEPRVKKVFVRTRVIQRNNLIAGVQALFVSGSPCINLLHQQPITFLGQIRAKIRLLDGLASVSGGRLIEPEAGRSQR